VANSARQAGAAANLAANNKATRTYVFYPVAIETAGIYLVVAPPGEH